jgi:2-iminobutanoate/2-iminopropanoate deaminase
MRYRLSILLLGSAVGLFAGITAQAGEAGLQYLNSDAETASKMPFSEAVRVGELLFVSGAIGIKPGARELVPGGIQPETRQTMENIKATVEQFGGSMDRPVKCTVFLADIAEWGKMNQVYVEYFPVNKPARSALGASGLALGARVEIECIFAL